MRGAHVREPSLELPELPPGITEITITRAGRTFTTHTRKPWWECMAIAERAYTDMKPIGGPAVPVKAALPPPKRQAAAPRAMPYRDDE